MKKKICQIGTLKFGIGHYLAHLYPELSSDYDLTVVTYTHGSPGDELIMDDEVINKNVKKYIQLINPHGFKNSTDSINSLFNLFSQENFALLNLHISSYTRKSAYIFIPVIEFFKKKGLKVLYTMHDVLPTPEGHDPTIYLHYYYNLADAAIVGNRSEEKIMKETFGFSKPTFIACHGVYQLLNQKKLTQVESRNKLGIPLDKKVLLFFGILRDNKGLDDLINALNLLKGDYILIIAISQRLGFTFEKYQKLLDQYHLAPWLKVILKDESAIEDIECYFQASDLVVLPYTSTSQSGVLNLAFAFEKPSIISNMFAEAEVVDGKMGFVVPPHNPKQLAEKIELFFTDRERYLKTFHEHIRQYNQNHGFRQTAQVYKEAFAQLLKI
jgi:glycosyltransferase involved in cell wall biosynthesis